MMSILPCSDYNQAKENAVCVCVCVSVCVSLCVSVGGEGVCVCVCCVAAVQGRDNHRNNMPSLLPYAIGYTEQPWHSVGEDYLKVCILGGRD